MTAPVKVVSARTPELVEAQIQRAEESGWELAWPVQGARSVTPDGAWDMSVDPHRRLTESFDHGRQRGGDHLPPLASEQRARYQQWLPSADELAAEMLADRRFLTRLASP